MLGVLQETGTAHSSSTLAHSRFLCCLVWFCLIYFFLASLLVRLNIFVRYLSSVLDFLLSNGFPLVRTFLLTKYDNNCASVQDTILQVVIKQLRENENSCITCYKDHSILKFLSLIVFKI